MKHLRNRVLAGAVALVMLATAVITDSRPVLAEDKASSYAVEMTDTATPLEEPGERRPDDPSQPDVAEKGDASFNVSSNAKRTADPVTPATTPAAASDNETAQVPAEASTNVPATAPANAPVNAPAKAPGAQQDYKFTARWANPVNATSDGYDYEDANNTILRFNPVFNKAYAASVEVSFNLTDTGNVKTLQKDSVKVTLPSALFTTWAGDTGTYWAGAKPEDLAEKDQMQTQVPQGTTSDAMSFSWTGDLTDPTGTITVSNTKPINGSTADIMQFSYYFIPTLLGVNEDGNYEKSFDVTISVDSDNDGTSEYTQTKKLTVKAHTEAKEPTLTMTRADVDSQGNTKNEDVYFNWQAAWGPKPADADNYFYVVYRADLERFGTRTESSTQPFSYTFENLGSPANEQGELIGARCRSEEAFNDLSTARDVHPPYSGIAKKDMKDPTKDWEHVIWSDGAAQAELRKYQGINDNFTKGIRQNYLDLGGRYLNNISSRDTSGCKSFFLLMRYPNQLIEDARKNGVDLAKVGINVHNTVKVTQISRDGNAAHNFTLNAVAEANVLVQEKGQYGYCKDYDGREHNKNANWPGNAYGAQTAIIAGKEAPMESGGNMWGERSFVHTAETRAQNPQWDAVNGTYTTSPRRMIIAERKKILSQRVGGVAGDLSGLIGSQTLTDADVRYKMVRVLLSEYDAVRSNVGVWAKNTQESKQYGQYSPVSVYIRKAGKSTYAKYADIQKTGGTSYHATFMDGSAEQNLSNKPLSLPENVVDVRFMHDSEFFATRLQIEVVEYLQPTASVKNFVEDCVNQNRATLYTAPADFWLTENLANVFDPTAASIPAKSTDSTDEEHTVYITHSMSKINRSSTVSVSTIKLSDIEDDSAHREQRTNVFVRAQNTLGALGDSMDLNKAYVTDKDIVGRYAMNKGVFYNLLPAGTKIDSSTLKVGREYFSQIPTEETPGEGLRRRPVSIPSSYYDVEQIPNYKGSGATMLKVTLKDLPEEDKPYPNDKYGAYDRPQYTLFMKYTLINTYENIQDRGSDVVNTAAFVNTSTGEWDPNDIDFTKPSNPRTYAYYKDLADDNRDPKTGSTNNFGLTNGKMSFKSITVAHSGAQQQVRNLDNDEKFGATTDVKGYNHIYTDANYEYKLAYYQDSKTKGSDIVFYDILDQRIKPDSPESEWQGTFVGIDLSAIESKLSSESNDYAKPKLYYAETAEVMSNGNMNVDDSSIWKAYPADDSTIDKSKIKAIAIDVRKTENGKDFVLGPSQALVAYVRMKAPNDPALDGKTAVNEFQVNATNVSQNTTQNRAVMLRNANPNGGKGLNSLYAACKVTLHKIGIALEKTSNPESGTEKAPAIVKNEKDEPITYTITVKNTCQELPLTGVVVEDAIPAGLIIDAENIRMESTMEKDPTKLKQNVTQTVHGQKLSWTIAILDKSESITFTVPTKLEKKFTKNTTFANCAHVTEANGKTITVDSDTTYHQVPVDIDIPVTKVWKDYDGKDLTTTPDKVTVALYGDQKQLKTLDLEKKDSWKGTFKDVPSNDPKTGEPYTFTVKEVGTNANGLIQIRNDWYTASVVGDQTQGFTVTNTKHKPWTPIVPATTSLTVAKSWSGVAQSYYDKASVTVALYKNGQATGTTATLDKANQFTATFKDLKIVDDVTQQRQNQYTAKELDANGKALENGDKVTILNKIYTVQYGQVVGGKQTITNIHRPKPTPTLPAKPQPKTGDSHRLLFWSALLGVSILSLTFLYSASEKRKGQKNAGRKKH